MTKYHFSVFMVARIYKYGSDFKVVWFRFGTDVSQVVDFDKPDNVNDGKLKNNISRARGRVLEISLCNEWEWFVTLTLDGNKQDRESLDGFVKALGNWVGNFNRKYGCKLKYVLIPELHHDGKSWHMHGLLHDVPVEALAVNEHGYMDIPYYRQRFGYISLSRIRSRERVSRYITKYISKSMSARIGDKAKHLFYASRGLSGKELIAEVDNLPVMDGAYVGDYTISTWIRDTEYVRKILDGED